MYLTLKTIHIGAVTLSGLLFFIRGLWLLTNSSRRQRRWVKVTPHLIDTILLLSAIALAIMLRQYPFIHDWLTAKVVALILYIALGMMALRFARRRPLQLLSWCGALLMFAYIVAVALSHNPWPFAY
jgi:uncharacterized membrane protein SirB2